MRKKLLGLALLFIALGCAEPSAQRPFDVHARSADGKVVFNAPSEDIEDAFRSMCANNDRCDRRENYTAEINVSRSGAGINFYHVDIGQRPTWEGVPFIPAFTCRFIMTPANDPITCVDPGHHE